MMPNQNERVFPNRRRRPRLLVSRGRQLVSLPRTYFEVDDIRPGEDELSEYMIEIFENEGIITIPKELNRKILQYLPGKDLLRFSMASKKAFLNVEFSHALMYDAIHERINDLVNVSNPRRRRNQNEHKFRVGNCVRVRDNVSGYVVRVTPKRVYYVKENEIFHEEPVIHQIGNDEVTPMRPYYAAVPVEVVKNWRTWASMTEELPYSD